MRVGPVGRAAHRACLACPCTSGELSHGCTAWHELSRERWQPLLLLLLFEGLQYPHDLRVGVKARQGEDGTSAQLCMPRRRFTVPHRHRRNRAVMPGSKKSD